MEHIDSSIDEVITILKEMIRMREYILVVDVTRNASVINVTKRHQIWW